MATLNNEDLTQRRFLDLLEIHGGDLERWPGELQPAARALVAREPTSALHLAQAQAFDRVLDLAPRALPPSPALLERIAAAARQDGARRRLTDRPAVVISIGAGEVVTLPRRPGSRSPGLAPGSRAGGWNPQLRQVAGAGGLMAASLLVGLWLGASGAASPSLGAVMANRHSTTDLDALTEIIHSAMPLDLLEGSDEDLL